MSGVNSIGGNFGFNFDKKVTSPINLGKTDALLFNTMVNNSDAVQISKTPGNTGLSESTARGTLRQLDEIEAAGL